MKTKLITTILIFMMAWTCFAKTGWMNIPLHRVDWFKPKVITRDNTPIYNPNFTKEELEAVGIFEIEAPDCGPWDMVFDYENKQIYQIFTEETNRVVEIDSLSYHSGLQFASILNMYFPDVGAITNRNITETYVTDFFAAKLLAKTITAEDLGYVTMLERLFSILKNSSFNPSSGTTWDFPFGQTEVIVPYIRRYYLNNNEKKYLN